MAKRKKKKINWIKLPVSLMDDERIAELIALKGVSGLGVYFFILCEMYRRQCRCLTMTQVKAIKPAGATQKTVLSVVNDYGLFRIDKMNHVYSVIDFLGFEDDIESASDDDPNDIVSEFVCPPSPARVYKKDIDEDIDHHIDGDAASGSGQQNEDYISMIPQDSSWTEAALMKSGFSTLIIRNWQVTLEQFRIHTTANCTIGSIQSVEDAKRYFHFYITNVVSGGMLRKFLEDYERNHPEGNNYCFEDKGSMAGHRSYMGMSLPDDAPPRPDDRADWDYDNHIWITNQ